MQKLLKLQNLCASNLQSLWNARLSSIPTAEIGHVPAETVYKQACFQHHRFLESKRLNV